MNRVGPSDRPNRLDSLANSREESRAARPEDQTGDRREPEHAPSDGLWDINEVSDYLHVPVSSIYKMTARHPTVRIPHIRIGSKLRFRRGDIDHWLALLSTSDIPALTKLRRRIQEITHGDDP